jgi:hypothetical protein
MVKKGILAFVLVVIAWFLIDTALQASIFDGLCKQTQQLWRSPEQTKKGLSFVVTAIAAAAFVAIFTQFFAKKNLMKGLGYGLLFGIAVGVTKGHGSFAVMPIPYYLALGWFLGTVLKGVVGGAILGLVVRD